MSESEEENLMSFDCVVDGSWLELLDDEINERLGQLALTKSTVASIFATVQWARFVTVRDIRAG